jgi:hypothetical protein
VAETNRFGKAQPGVTKDARVESEHVRGDTTRRQGARRVDVERGPTRD